MSAQAIPSDWELIPTAFSTDLPRYRHTCGGLVKIWRSHSDKAVDRAYCEGCGTYWHRPDARFNWREGRR